MTISFGDARELVRAAQEGLWEKTGFGQFYLAPYGTESPTHWQVIYGAREALVDHDFMYVLMDVPITLVSKDTGTITEINFLANLDLVNAMTPVGNWPARGNPTSRDPRR